MKAIINVGLVGYGFASKTFHAPLIQATAGLDLVLSLPVMRPK